MQNWALTGQDGCTSKLRKAKLRDEVSQPCAEATASFDAETETISERLRALGFQRGTLKASLR
jgi:hypothetical protein